MELCQTMMQLYRYLGILQWVLLANDKLNEEHSESSLDKRRLVLDKFLQAFYVESYLNVSLSVEESWSEG